MSGALQPSPEPSTEPTVPGFTTEPTGDGDRHRLPPRRLWIGTGIVGVFCLFLFGFTGLWQSNVIGDVFDPSQPAEGRIFSGVFMVVGMVPALVGLGLGLLGLWLAAGRCDVEVERAHLRSVERLGPLHWARRTPLADIHGFEVKTATASTNNGPSRPVQRLATLVAQRGEGVKPRLIAVGYPRRTLHALADRLAEACDASHDHHLLDDAPPVRVTDTLPTDADDPDNPAGPTPDQPASSTAQLAYHDQGVTVHVPPVGLRGTKGLFTFAALWNVMLCAITGFFIYGILFGKPGGDPPPVLVLIGFALVFWGVGIGIAFAAINMARRRAILDVVGFPPGATVLVTRKSLLGTKQREWPAAELKSIRFGPSGTEVNNRPVNELQIHPKAGKKVGILSQRDDEELRWLAALLRETTGVNAR